MAGTEDAANKDEQARDVSLSPFTLARVVIPQTRGLDGFEEAEVEGGDEEE